jgi:hypothetical protein
MSRRYRRRYSRRVTGKEGAVIAVIAGVALAAVAHGASTPGAATAQTLSAGSTSTGTAVATGQQMAAARGWTGSQWDCLDWLWTRESGWNPYAANPTSDARGIPQNINGWGAYGPGDVPAQITWGLDYIAGRYGTPCAAWAHETADSWY